MRKYYFVFAVLIFFIAIPARAIYQSSTFGNRSAISGGGGSSSTGLLLPSDSANTETTGYYWQNLANAKADDGSYMAGADSVTQANGKVYTFTSGLTSETIDGIEVKAECRDSAADGGWQLYYRISTNGGSSWTDWKNGTAWTSGPGSSWVVDTIGGPSDLWGRAFSASDINNIQVEIGIYSGDSYMSECNVDYVGIDVYYTE